MHTTLSPSASSKLLFPCKPECAVHPPPRNLPPRLGRLLLIQRIRAAKFFGADMDKQAFAGGVSSSGAPKGRCAFN